MSQPHYEFHTIRLANASQPLCDRLVADGVLKHVHSSLPGEGVQLHITYKLDDPSNFAVQDDETCTVSSFFLQAQFDRLPADAYSAVVRESPRFKQFININTLLGGLRNGIVTDELLRRRLELTVKQGRRYDSLPRLVEPHVASIATWLRDETVLCRTSTGDWFLQLTFRTAGKPQRCHPQLTTQKVYLTPTLILHQHELTPAAWRLYQQLLYASHRLDADCSRLNYLDMAQIIALRRQQSRARQQAVSVA